MTWVEILQLALTVLGALGGIAVATVTVFALFVRPSVHYSITSMPGMYFRTIGTGPNGPNNVEEIGRTVRVWNKSRLPLSAKDLWIHIRTAAPITNVRQSGFYESRASKTSDDPDLRDATFYLAVLPPNGKLALDFFCRKSDVPKDETFFVDHSVLTSSGKAHKCKTLKGFEAPDPA